MKKNLRIFTILFVLLMMIPFLSVKAYEYDSNKPDVPSLRVFEDGTVKYDKSQFYDMYVSLKYDESNQYLTSIFQSIDAESFNIINLIENECAKNMYAFNCREGLEGTYDLLIRAGDYNSEFTFTYADGKISGSIVEQKYVLTIQTNEPTCKVTYNSKDYSNGDLVIYNGLGKEKEYIVTMVNTNKKLKIIDSTNRIEYKYSQDEVWINPSNVLMVARNIREGLKEYVISENLDKKIDDNYEALKINISNIDVELKDMAENASNKDILVQSNELTFLSKYGLNITSIDADTITDKIYNDASNLVEGGEIKYVFILNGEEENEFTKKLKEEVKDDLEVVYIDPINNISTEDKNNGKDYISIMNDNIDKLKQELY